jgi:hypothetical protein
MTIISVETNGKYNFGNGCMWFDDVQSESCHIVSYRSVNVYSLIFCLKRK